MLKLLEVLDSRGNPTIEVSVLLDDGSYGTAIVPSGASTGIHEALEMRDGDKTRYNGKGVLKAVENVNGEIAENLLGMDAIEQKDIDEYLIALDGTKNKSRLGANAILGVSLAVAKAAAESHWYASLSLYRRCLCPRIARSDDEHPQWRRPHRLAIHRCPGIHGHAPWELPVSLKVSVGAQKFTRRSKAFLKARGYTTLVGDEGGYAPALKANNEAVEVILEAIEKAGYKAGEQVAIALDPAASELFDEETRTYNLRKEGKKLTGEQMVDFWKNWVRQYPIVSIEDGLAQDDWESWKLLTKEIGDKVQIVGDDLLVTNTERVRRAIKEESCNALLVKLQSDWQLSQKPSKLLKPANVPAGVQSPLTAPVRPRTPPLPTWWLPSTVVRSRPVLLPVLTVLQNTIN